MQNKNKVIAVICSTALLGTTLIHAQGGPGAAGFGAFNQTMQNVKPMIDQANSAYKDATDTASGMENYGKKYMENGSGSLKPMPPLPPTLGFGPLVGFLKKKEILTESEQTQLKEYIGSYIQTIKGIIENTTLTQEEKSEKIKTANKAFGEKIASYVESEKLEKFNTWLTEMGDKPLIPGPQGNPNRGADNISGTGADHRNDMMPPGLLKKDPSKMEKKFILSQRTRDLFNAKLNSIPTEKKLELFKKVLAKLDILIEKANDGMKAKLQELKDILVIQIDNITNPQSEENIINGLFQDTGSGSSSGTGTSN